MDLLQWPGSSQSLGFFVNSVLSSVSGTQLSEKPPTTIAQVCSSGTCVITVLNVFMKCILVLCVCVHVCVYVCSHLFTGHFDDNALLFQYSLPFHVTSG